MGKASEKIPAKLLNEFVGTFFFVLVWNLSDAYAGTGFEPFAVGNYMMIFTFVGAHISGAQYNPATALAVYLRFYGSLQRQFPWEDFVLYVTTQFIGGLCGGVVAAFIGGQRAGDIYFHRYDGINYAQAFFAEVFFTFLLIYVMLIVTAAKQLANNQFYGLCVGMVYMVSAMSIGQITGSCLNPALYIGTLVPTLFLTHDITLFDDAWVFFFAPLVSSFLAVGVYTLNEMYNVGGEIYEETESDEVKLQQFIEADQLRFNNNAIA